ncbi:PIN domain-containing protein [Klebsiella quasipneumoniae]|uniref:PIN domain-containing protein n=1 Tax=Klebsiella quasipneumoniae TaxID=1463165 RepID=UPI000C79DA7F|nr:PIN domain-containing protein [Klebsiella quasipneumoniae]PLJ36418.1 PIN domain-containing protein [Klebsiella quasipneumoniae]PLJ49441.1 PIN domain-containing protein [Klebsiella quasipneumoniae]PLJ57351.1 PIN domain-containing protein [Klebsiella quasipneumoniae]
MTHSPYPVVLDACVLYPSMLRDLLMHLGKTGLYQPKWTDLLHAEWQRNLLMNRPDIKAEQLKRTEMLMNKAFGDACVTGYESIIDGLNLPDRDDRHVLAAAIRSDSEVIVTYNLVDFPSKNLVEFDIEALHPDEFLSDLFDLNHALVLEAVRMQRSHLRNPPLTPDQFLQSLLQLGLPKTVTELEKYRFMI